MHQPSHPCCRILSCSPTESIDATIAARANENSQIRHPGAGCAGSATESAVRSLSSRETSKGSAPRGSSQYKSVCAGSRRSASDGASAEAFRLDIGLLMMRRHGLVLVKNRVLRFPRARRRHNMVLSAYEVERALQVERNEAVLKELNLVGAAAACRHPPKPIRSPRIRSPCDRSQQKQRSSRRLAGGSPARVLYEPEALPMRKRAKVRSPNRGSAGPPELTEEQRATLANASGWLAKMKVN